MRGQKQLFSSVLNSPNSSDLFETPRGLFDWLHATNKFTIDLAASDNNHLLPKYYTEKTDALKQCWANEVGFLNNPYSMTDKFSIKAVSELKIWNDLLITMLVPARVDTLWFHRLLPYMWKLSFIKGRLKFTINGQPILSKKGQPMGAPFPSILIYLDSQQTINRSLLITSTAEKTKAGYVEYLW